MKTKNNSFPRDIQYYKFSLYGFLKNLKFFDPFIILFFREMGFSFLEIGTLFGIREISTYIFEIPTGIIADAYGRRVSMIYSFISYIISFLIFYFFHSFTLYIFAMILFASGEAFRTGTHKAMILGYLKINNLLDHKVDYYGHTRGWSQIGSAISSLIAAGLVFYTGSYKIIFLASTIPYIFDLLLIITYPKELDGEIKTSNIKNTISKSKNSFITTITEIKNLAKSKKAIKALINSSLFDAIFKTVKDYIQPIIKQYALLLPIFLFLNKDKRVAITIGIIYSILFLLTSFSSSNAGKAAKKIKSLSKAINISYILGALLISITGILIILKIYIPAIIIFIIFYMLENIKRPINLGYVSELISSKIMATGLSGESQLKAIFVTIFAPLMGFIADKFGIGTGLIVFASLLLILFPFLSIGKIKNE